MGSPYLNRQRKSDSLMKSKWWGLTLKYLRWSNRRDFSGTGTWNTFWLEKKPHALKPNFLILQNARVVPSSSFSRTQNTKQSADQIISSITTVCCLKKGSRNITHWTLANHHSDKAYGKSNLILQNQHSCVRTKGSSKKTLLQVIFVDLVQITEYRMARWVVVFQNRTSLWLR